MQNPAKDLFDQAVGLEPSIREAFLAQACGEDTELMFEIQGMICGAQGADSFLGGEEDSLMAMVGKRLAAHREAGDFDAPVPPEAAAVLESLRSEEEGEMIGSYKLLQEIGQGGFGSVWMAQQSKPISRKVALKVIKMGMDTREVIARFEAERQALAMMDHPNIAKVLDAGATDRGRPFFVMELVKGIPITEYCDEAGLGTTERLELFRDVCSAINHAHQKGIIHRDIKPSNVMVTLHGDKPVVKVIDFGIAKATQGKLTDQTLFTRFEQFIGTPVYMSPEQAALSGLDIDTRSDIYALGILLYELLVGKPPFDAKSLVSAGYEEMRRIIREVEPPKPSSRLSTVAGDERTQLAKTHRIEEAKLNKLVEPDLDWIVMKAIDKDRTRRYETANAFALDIKCFLDDEAVSARPPSAAYQFRKFARRNKAALRVAAAIAAVLVVATGVSTWQAVRATRAEKKTAVTLAQVAAERDAKELARKDAENISNFLSEVFQSPDPTRDGREITVAETLDKAAKKLDTDLSTQPAQRAKLQVTLGRTYGALGLYQQATALLEKARDYYLATSGAEHPDTITVMSQLAWTYACLDRWDEAIKLQEEVLLLRRKVLGPDHLNTLRAMVDLGNYKDQSGRLDEGIKLLEEVLPLLRKKLGSEHNDTIRAMFNLALCYERTDRQDEALKLREEMLTHYRKLIGPEHPSTLKAVQQLAKSYYAVGRRDEALKLREEGVPLHLKVLGPDHSDTLRAQSFLSISYYDAGRRDEALKLREEVLPLFRKALGLEHYRTLDAIQQLAASYTDAGRHDEALKLREEALEVQRKMNGPEHPNTLWAMIKVAFSYRDAGRLDAAIKLGQSSVDLFRHVSGSTHSDTLNAMTELAISYQVANRIAEAIPLEEESLRLKRQHLPPGHMFTMESIENLATCYEKAGRKPETLTLREEALEHCRKANGPEHPDALNAMESLAKSYRANGEVAKAEAMEKEISAVEEHEKASPPVGK